MTQKRRNASAPDYTGEHRYRGYPGALEIGKSDFTKPVNVTEKWLFYPETCCDQMKCKIIIIGMLWVFLLSGCAAIQREKIPAEDIVPDLKWHLASYTEFVKENMAEINANYSTEYTPYEFVVDTDYGSTMIQNLLDPESATVINTGLISDANPHPSAPLMRIYQHIINHYDYILDPLKWQSVTDTIKTQKGDCKSLSLLLMSCLTAVGYETYAGISNGHMWINVNYDNQWRVLELDLDPERNTIYRIPGFYENPLYKIYPDRSEKRKRMKQP